MWSAIDPSDPFGGNLTTALCFSFFLISLRAVPDGSSDEIEACSNGEPELRSGSDTSVQTRFGRSPEPVYRRVMGRRNPKRSSHRFSSSPAMTRKMFSVVGTSSLKFGHIHVDVSVCESIEDSFVYILV